MFIKDARFFDATFSGAAMFEDAIFEGGAVFNRATFAASAVFYRATFSGAAWFFQVTFREYASFASVKFEDANFEAVHGDRLFTLAGTQFKQVPNFIQAHFQEAPRLDDVSIPEIEGIGRFLFPALPGIVADSEASARYRALKRLAIQAHDHARELDYLSSELKALRGNPDKIGPCPLNLVRKDDEGKRRPIWPGGLRGTARYWVGLFYEIFSNFRSIILPLFWLVFSAAGFACIYLHGRAAPAGAGCIVGKGEAWTVALGLSIRKALPFASVASANKLDQIYACLYGIHSGSLTTRELPDRFTPIIPDLADYIGILQILLSLMLIFLFLLAVRNHFRIR